MNAATGLTQALAERISATRWDDLPAAAQTVAKQCLLDFIGVALAGAREPLAANSQRRSRRRSVAIAQASADRPRRRGNVEQAALINGAAGHAHDYDDVHMAMNGHPTVPVAPAALALAEHLRHRGAGAARRVRGRRRCGVHHRTLPRRVALRRRLARDRHARQLRCGGGRREPAAARCARRPRARSASPARRRPASSRSSARCANRCTRVTLPPTGVHGGTPRRARLHEPHRHPRNGAGLRRDTEARRLARALQRGARSKPAICPASASNTTPRVT